MVLRRAVFGFLGLLFPGVVYLSVLTFIRDMLLWHSKDVAEPSDPVLLCGHYYIVRACLLIQVLV